MGTEKGFTDADRYTVQAFREKQEWSTGRKITYAANLVEDFIDDCKRNGKNYHVSIGGLDSITLLIFIRDYCRFDVPAISVSSLEDKSIQKIHKQLGVECLKPAMRSDGHRWNKQKIIQEFGFPVLSKEIALKIETLQNPTDKNKTVRHAIITGETGEYGGFRTGTRMQLKQKWLEKFGGYENENEGVNFGIPDFRVSSKCCYYLKEKPCEDWAKEHNSVPFLGLMASEHGRREKSLMLNGCNYWGKTTVRSAPFAIFKRQDLLSLALDLNVPIPEIYGEIKSRNQRWDGDIGELYTTGAQRTGCSMCGFGIHLEERPHRFDRLRERNPKEWEFWMYRCVTDPVTGEKYGWGRVLDYIGVPWEDEFFDIEQHQVRFF